MGVAGQADVEVICDSISISGTSAEFNSAVSLSVCGLHFALETHKRGYYHNCIFDSSSLPLCLDNNTVINPHALSSVTDKSTMFVDEIKQEYRSSFMIPENVRKLTLLHDIFVKLPQLKAAIVEK